MPGFRQSNFAAGEISPYLYERTDLARYNAGLRTCLNAIPLPQGPLVNRAGFQYIAQTKSSGVVRLVPFQFSNSVSYILEFGNNYIRFYVGGQLVINPETLFPYEVTTTYTTAELPRLQFAQIGDYIAITHPLHKPAELHHVSNDPPDWTLTDSAPNRMDSSTWTIALSEGLPATIWEVGRLYNAGNVVLGSNGHYYRSRKDGLVGGYAPNETEGAVNWYDIGTTLVVDSVGGPSRPPKTWSWVFTWVDIVSGVETLASIVKTDTVVLYSDRPIKLTATFGYPSGLSYLGGFFNVYRGRNEMYGYIGQVAYTGGSTFTFLDEGQAPDFSLQPPKGLAPFSSLQNYPSAVTHYEQRRVYANTTLNPQKINLTKTGAFFNFDAATSPRDSDAIEFNIASEKFEEIRWLIAMKKLVVGTSSSEWAVSGNNGPISPTSIDAKVQSRHGSAWITPVVVGNSILFVKEKGSAVRDLIYDYNSDTYQGTDLSLLASHLFLGRKIVDWTFQSVPNSVIWAVRDDGVLLGLTYMKDQEVVAWHRHTTDGVIENVCAVSETSEDFLYLVVRRVINGATRRYIERMNTRNISDITQGAFLDSFFVYQGSPVTVISGLDHINAKEVYALIDGYVQGPYTVDDGTITLENETDFAIIGLPYTTEIELLDLVIQGQEMRDRYKTVRKVMVELSESQTIWIGETRDSMTRWSYVNVGETYTPAISKSNFVELHIANTWNKGGRVIIQQRDPLPITIHSVTREVEFGGD